MYKTLKRVRLCVSVAFLLLISLAAADAAFAITPFGSWIMHVQIVPAILGGAAVWLVLWVLITLTFGRVYCSTVCPMGTLQDAAAWLGRMTGVFAPKRYRYAPPADVLRVLVALVVMACFFAGVTGVVRATDPYEVYTKMVVAVTRPATIGFGSLAAAVLAFLVIWATAWRRGRLLCNTVCAAGGLLGLLGRQPIYRIDINTDKCIHCGKCEDVCKASCINLRDCVVDNSRCVMCLDCTEVCPNDAITVRRGRYHLSTPMMQPVN